MILFKDPSFDPGVTRYFRRDTRGTDDFELGIRFCRHRKIDAWKVR